MGCSTRYHPRGTVPPYGEGCLPFVASRGTTGDMATSSPLSLTDFAPLSLPPRLLLGPGPSLVHPRVLGALSMPTIGHLDPVFLRLMDEVQVLLRALFNTRNALTFAISGTGSAGMEACMANVLQRGERVVIAQNGVFGGRMADIGRRLGCEVEVLEVPFGQAIDPDDLRRALGGKPTRLVGFVHAETSTGVLQDVPPLVAAAREVGALTLMDCVTSLGGVPVDVDGWGVDLAYAGTQKCLSCPPGLAPITFSAAAVDVLRQRKEKVASWYLDVTMLLNYWGGERAYHHTAPINMLYALREAALLPLEEGLPNVFARHLRVHRALVAGLEAMGLQLAVAPALRLPQLNNVQTPRGVEDAAMRRSLLQDYDVEVGGGLGAFKGKAFRIGLMGHSARPQHVLTCLAALEQVLSRQGAQVDIGAALPAASAELAR